MKNRPQIPLLYIAALTLLLVTSCKKPNEKKSDPIPEVSKKVYILNEGSFLNSNASVSIFDLTENKMYNDMFNDANGRVLGDVLQSMTIVNGNAYCVLNNSDKIEIMGTYPLTSTGVINGLSQPRYMNVVSDTKAYVSEYISYGNPTGRISIVDLTTNTITGAITVGANPENILYFNGKAYVCISGENKIEVINTATDAIETSIVVAKGPNSIVKDASNKLWVLCGGEIAYDGSWNVDEANSIPGALVRIDPISNTVETTYTFSDNVGSPSRLQTNGIRDRVYYTYANAVYSMLLNETALPTTPLINRNFYGLGIDPVTNTIYTGTYGFSSNQKMIRYSPYGVALDSFTVGIGPNGFVFN